MTKKEINAELGIMSSMNPITANEELSEEDERLYRDMVRYVIEKGKDAANNNQEGIEL